jgi:putative ABC transport system permease protein
MPFLEAVRLALRVIWTQKMKSSFSVIGIFIGVTFLIAVVSVVEGMNEYMTESFANKLLGVNTFQLRRYPGVQMGDISSEAAAPWSTGGRSHATSISSARPRTGSPSERWTSRLDVDSAGRRCAPDSR